MALSSILSVAVIFLVILIIVLTIVYLGMSAKERKAEVLKAKSTKGTSEEESKDKIAKSYTKDSIFNFMEFDKVEDNMIVQKGGKKFLMVIECQGINYDLMSDIEKTSVESGFIQFLNTLRSPIQIYVQTRTINLEDSLKNYKDRLIKIENELRAKENKYKSMIESGNYTQKQIDFQRMEIERQNNLYDYGRDIIFNTERMSMNKNVLRKKYYVILSYYYNNVDGEQLEESEIRETAFSDLYTKCQSTIRALAVSGVNGRVLDSYELVDLLYNAYNRDEAENYGIEKAEKAGFDNLYVTTPDILERKMKALDKKISEDALDLAESSIKYANEELQKEIEEKEESYEDLVAELANQLIEENAVYFSEDLTKEAKKQVKKVKEANKNAKKERKTKSTTK